MRRIQCVTRPLLPHLVRMKRLVGPRRRTWTCQLRFHTKSARFRECAGAAFEGRKRVAGGEAAGAEASDLLYVPVPRDRWLCRRVRCRCAPQTRPSAPLSPPKTASQGVHKQGDSAVVRSDLGEFPGAGASYLLYSTYRTRLTSLDTLICR